MSGMSIWHPQANDRDCYPLESERCTTCGALLSEPCSPGNCPRMQPDEEAIADLMQQLEAEG